MIDSGKASVDILATHLDNKRTVPVPIPNCKDVKTVLFCHNLSSPLYSFGVIPVILRKTVLK